MDTCYKVQAAFLAPAGGAYLEIDYFELYGASEVATEKRSWGAIKNLFRE
jgi:hypothetical protein